MLKVLGSKLLKGGNLNGFDLLQNKTIICSSRKETITIRLYDFGTSVYDSSHVDTSKAGRKKQLGFRGLLFLLPSKAMLFR